MQDDAGPDLRQYLTVLRRRKASLVLVTLAVTVGAVVASSLQSPTYQASAQVRREAQPVDPLAPSANNAVLQRELYNEIRELESTNVREAVAKAYTGPVPVSSVKGSVVASNADVIQVSASGGNPQEVAKLVNTYVNTYVKFRTEQQLAVLLETANELRQQADELTKRIAEASAPLVALDAQIIAAAAPQRGDLQRRRDAQAEELASQLTDLQAQRNFYQQQLDKVLLSSRIRQGGSLRVLAAATAPQEPISPKPLRNGALGLALGLLLGSAAAFARERLDDTVRDKATLEAESQLSTLGVIPLLPRLSGKPLNEVVTISAHTSAAAEAYRTLRTSVKFLSEEDDCRVFQITSATAAEGKTLTAMNLAVALSQAGDRTIVVGCDLRRPRLDSLAHTHQGPGLTSVLVGDAELHEAVERHEEVELSILRTGPIPTDPSELLSSPRTAALIRALRSAFDVVILDCPPLLPVSDALILAGYSDATLVVVSEGKTSRRNLARALELLRQVNAPLRGTVLNGTRSAGGYGYGYRYDAYAQSSPSPTAEPRRGRRIGGPDQGTVLTDP